MLLHLAVEDNSISATLNELLLLPISMLWSSEAPDVGLIPMRQETTHGDGSSLIYNGWSACRAKDYTIGLAFLPTQLSAQNVDETKDTRINDA